MSHFHLALDRTLQIALLHNCQVAGGSPEPPGPVLPGWPRTQLCAWESGSRATLNGVYGGSAYVGKQTAVTNKLQAS